MLTFPKATENLLVLIHENQEDLATAIDKYLQDFGTQCAQKFLTSLTSAPDLFPRDELLDRMREEQL
jgi:hypothetical protein